MYDTVNSAFSDALKREGRVITSYTDNTLYNVLFRRNSDRNKMQNTITIYYSADSGVRSGQLLKYKGNTYLTINQETAENDIYLKSDMFQTNALLNFISGGMEFSLPAYAYDVRSALSIDSNVISIVGGNLEVIAEDNPITSKLAINNTFYALGGYWKIDNLIYKDNVIHIYAQREAASTTYTVSITAEDSYNRGTAAQFTAIAKAGTTTITNANINWTSSDTSKATVDENGLVTFIANGSVTISAVWQEHNTTGTKIVTITEPPVYGLVINSESTYLTTDTPTLTATATEDGAVISTATITWESNNLDVATIDNTGAVTFLSDGEVTITAFWTEHNISATKNITVSAPAAGYTCAITNTQTPPVPYDDSTNPIQIKIGGTKKPLVAQFYDSAGAEVAFTPVWSLSNLSAEQQSAVHLTYNETYPTRCYLQCDNISSLIGTTFNLVLTDSDNQSSPCTRIVSITSYS